ncbi:hypothetical protein [Komagataeibacter oboediens]
MRTGIGILHRVEIGRGPMGAARLHGIGGCLQNPSGKYPAIIRQMLLMLFQEVSEDVAFLEEAIPKTSSCFFPMVFF